MLKNLTAGIVGVTIVIGLTGCGDTELKDSEIKNLAICKNTSTGVARYKTDIEYIVTKARFSGSKTIVTKNDDTLTITIDEGKNQIIEKFKKIPEGELSKYNIKCYEMQSFQAGDKIFSKKDQTLNGLMWELYGMLLPTEQQIRKNKQKRELEDKQRQEAQAKRQKEIEVQQAERKKQKLAKQQLRIDNIKKELNDIQIAQEKLNRFLAIKKEFEKTSGIVKHVDNMPNKIQIWDSSEAKNVKLTNKILNDYLSLFEATKSIDKNILLKRKSDIETIKKYFNLDPSKRTVTYVHNLFNIYGRLNYNLNESINNMSIESASFLQQELEKADECYRQIDIQGYCR